MSGIAVTMTIDGESMTDLLASTLDLTVEDDRRAAALLRLRLALRRAADGTWDGLDDARIAPWKPVSLSVTAGDAETEIFRGFVTNVKAHFAQELDGSWAEIVATDESVQMCVEEKLRDWPDKSDSDIATAILGEYGLTPQVETVDIMHEQAVATIIQRENDCAFLRRLAARNGFEFWVKNGEGVFKPPALDGEPQPVLSGHFGADTNLVSFDADLRAVGPTTVAMAHFDVIAKEIQQSQFSASAQPALGANAALSAAAPPSGTPVVHYKHAMPLSLPDMDRRCAAVGEEAGMFIRAEIEIDTAQYGSLLSKGDLVPVRGVGEVFSGVYYVTAVTYRVEGERLLQRVVGIRNASAPASPADFMGGLL